MTTLLVTAFGAFPGAPANPSAESVRFLDRVWRARFARVNIRLATAVLPVLHAIAPHLDALVAREKPDAIVHLGLAGGRRRISVEMRARNRASVLKPDARGFFGVRHVLSEDTRSHLRSPPVASKLVALLHAAGLDAQPSVDAGDYVCNATLWRSLETGAAPAVFIHVPKNRHAAPRKVAMALARILPAITFELARGHAGRRRANPGLQ
jgi:pyroglutamyl-peptidase